MSSTPRVQRGSPMTSPARPAADSDVRCGVVVLGSLNMDVVVPVETIPRPGETVLGGVVSRMPGGKGANQAVAVARLGRPVRLIGRLGDDDLGSVIQHTLGNVGIDLGHTRVLEGFGSGLAFVTVDASGENAIVVSPGANSEMSPAELELEEAALAHASIAIAQLETPLETVQRFAAMCEADGVHLVLNAAPYRELPDALLGRCRYLVLNRDEAGSLTGSAVSTRSDARRALHDVARRGVPHVVITLGGDGCVALTPAGLLELDAFDVPVVDTTGAGDAFVGALAAAIERGDSFDESLAFAAAAGAVACAHVGAQLGPTAHDEVSDLLRRQPRSSRSREVSESPS